MIRFECDYNEGMHPKILERMVETNDVSTIGYGEDIYCNNARDRIKKICGNDEAEVFFIVGGTLTNLTVISSILRPHQGVISTKWGHIATHETGAIEATGHKVIAIPSDDGKMTPEQIKDVYDTHWNDEGNREHNVQPGMVYISQPTECGSVYSLDELKAIHKSCKECDLPLFIDGARLGYGMVTEEGKMTFEDITNNCDVFYIGATKIGAMIGEAIVLPDKRFHKDFRYLVKQRGGLLAKGRFLGIQFEVLFGEDNLYLEISKNAIDRAMEIRNAFEKAGMKFLAVSPTNQQFPIMKNEHIAKLKEKYSFHVWEKIDEEYSAVRFCTSWATTKESVDSLVADIANLK